MNEENTKQESERKAYFEELRGELRRLELSQANNPSEYKEERIQRLRDRLGVKNDETDPILDRTNI